MPFASAATVPRSTPRTRERVTCSLSLGVEHPSDPSEELIKEAGNAVQVPLSHIWPCLWRHLQAVQPFRSFHNAGLGDGLFRDVFERPCIYDVSRQPAEPCGPTYATDSVSGSGVLQISINGGGCRPMASLRHALGGGLTALASVHTVPSACWRSSAAGKMSSSVRDS